MAFRALRTAAGPATSPPALVAGRLDGQALAALGTTRVDDGAATAGLHADEETVGAGAADFGGLVSTFHDSLGCRVEERPETRKEFSGKPAIITKIR